MPTKRKMTPEGSVKSAVEDFLKTTRIPYFRMNSGDRLGSSNGKKWRIRGHESGTADFLLCPNISLQNNANVFADVSGTAWFPCFLWVETKAPGKGPTDDQKVFAQKMQERGHYWLCIDDAAKLIAWLKNVEAR